MAGKMNRRKAFSLVLAGAGVGIAVPRVFAEDSVSFQDAKNNVHLRQQYMNQFMSDVNPSYVSSIVYDHDYSKLIDYFQSHPEAFDLSGDWRTPLINGSKRLLSCTPFMPRHFGNGMEVPIFVFPKLFNDYGVKSDNEVRLNMKHENIHAEDQVRGLRVGHYVITRSNAGNLEYKTMEHLTEYRA